MARERGSSAWGEFNRLARGAARMRQQQQRREAADQARRAKRAERSAQTYRSTIDGEPAVVREHDSGRVEAFWGGENSPDDPNGHGHIVTNDGTNAAYVRYPHETPVFDDPDDKRRR